MTGWEAEGIQHYEECVALGIDDQFRTPQAELASKKGNSGINVVELKTLQAVDANRLASDQVNRTALVSAWLWHASACRSQSSVDAANYISLTRTLSLTLSYAAAPPTSCSSFTLKDAPVADDLHE
eukprot:CAMPEP_0183336460 /NCGR_PEP_ID=MMETSP0164_2-20130417/4433_1 /TAXON_ID=221442 /ORGANISM="Coccolithus pelagicus ssp braarudi, Strain PLY182g" /LENGTH=125 /DNA_ID=CAMNT_0025505983 /DNA_START=155 /DNA_END=532 /DNA_ORIENTATION=-